MRVYTRGVDQGLMIGTDVQVNVLEVHSDRVRLAIIDPDASPTYREEVVFLPADDGDGFDSSESERSEYVPAFDLFGTNSLLASLR